MKGIKQFKAWLQGDCPILILIVGNINNILFIKFNI